MAEDRRLLIPITNPHRAGEAHEQERRSISLRSNGVTGAALTAAGACREATLGYFDPDATAYVDIPVSVQSEVLSLRVRHDRRCEGRVRPAVRPLPQLPITVDDDGYFVATGDFAAPVGPSFWEIHASS